MNWLQKIVLLLCLMLPGAWVQAKEVTATGTAAIFEGNTGSAKNQAILNAQRQAVEQGVGTFIDSNTFAQNFEVIKDEILSTSRGYITRYEVLQEGASADGTNYEVTIRAEVSDEKIQDQLKTLRILHQKMGNKRIMVIYQSADPNALPRDNSGVQSTLSIIRDQFNQAGFRVFNEQVMGEVYQAIERAAIVDRPAESLIALALDQRAEILVRLEMIAGKRGQKGGMFYAAKVMVRMQVYDASNGRQIADVTKEDKQLSSYAPGPYDWLEMLSKAGKRAGAEASKEAIERISEFYQSVGDTGFAYLIVFRNYTAEEEDKILDYLENTEGFKDLTELKNSLGYLELELFSSESKSRLRRKIRRDLKTEGIGALAQDATGNRMIFVNPAAMPPEEESSKIIEDDAE
ncbi:MAG: hypothetical protein HQM12_08360 [SAR324 cluster bacterium]|nr:hypothetical protein [SAR324 cluster bacterium]